MDTDAKIQPYVLLAKGARGRALVELITKATSEPGLFGFSELLHMPQIQEIANGEHAAHYQLLQLFAFGTWADYSGAAPNTLPALSGAQITKLKQLTVMSLALQHKVLPYTLLQQQLAISSVRELEDYIITECFYTGILHGKLDQKQACVQVHHVCGRDVRPEQLPVFEQGLKTWLAAADSVLTGIEERINDTMSQAKASEALKASQGKEIEEMKRMIKEELDVRNADMLLDEGGHDRIPMMDYMEDERMDFRGGRFLGGQDPRTEGHDRFMPRGARSKKRIQR